MTLISLNQFFFLRSAFLFRQNYILIIGRSCQRLSFSSSGIPAYDGSLRVKATSSRLLDTSFESFREAYQNKSNKELIRALLVFRLCGIDFFVKNSLQLMRFSSSFLGPDLFRKLMKKTFYGQFLAGETPEEVSTTIDRLSKSGIRSMLNYTVESDLGKVSGGDESIECDKAQERMSSSINFAASHKFSGFAAIKLTALTSPDLLMRLSKDLVSSKKLFMSISKGSSSDFYHKILDLETFSLKLKEFGVVDTRAAVEWFHNIDTNNDGRISFFDWNQMNRIQSSGDLQKTFLRCPKLDDERKFSLNSLPDEDMEELEKFLRRLTNLAELASAKDVHVMIDAEQTYFQPAISLITLMLMKIYNKDRVVIMNTYQAYLRQTFDNLETDLHFSRQIGFCFGCKMVRGAYITQERSLAEKMGYEDPINLTYEDTGKMYHRCLERLLEERIRRGSDKICVMVASHNEETARFAVRLMNRYNLPRDDHSIFFGQLYGMCDHVSLLLGQAGYNACKCVHYGPLEGTLPYLSRRAVENGSMLRNLGKERRLLLNELKERLFTLSRQKH